MLHIYSVLKLRKGSMVLKPVGSSKRQAVSTSHKQSLQSMKAVGKKRKKKAIRNDNSKTMNRRSVKDKVSFDQTSDSSPIEYDHPSPDPSSTLPKMREPYAKKTPSHDHRRSHLLHTLHQIAALRRESGTDATDQVANPPQVEKEVAAATKAGGGETSCPPDGQASTATALYKQLTPVTASRVLAVATICDFLSTQIVLPVPLIYINCSNTLIELIESEVLPVKQHDRLVVSAKCWVSGLIHHTLEYGAGTDPDKRQGHIHLVRSPIPFTFCTTITFPPEHEPIVHPADRSYSPIPSTPESTSRNPIICQLAAFTTDEVITWHSKEEHLRQSSQQSIVQLSLSVQLKLDLIQCQELMLCIQTGQMFRKMGQMNEENRIVKNDRTK